MDRSVKSEVRMKNTAYTIVTMCLMAGSASATTTATFDLSAPWSSSSYGNQGHSFSLTDGGLTATFSGNSFSSIGIDSSTNTITSATVQNGDVGRWSTGAGIQNSRSDSSHAVDGYGWADFFEISFSQDVTMHEVEFSYFHADQTYKKCSYSFRSGYRCRDKTVAGIDDFKWMYDLSGDGALGVGDYISENQSANPFTAFGGVTSNVFGFGAFDHNDDWKLKEITVKYDDAPGGPGTPPPVPLPAGGVLLVGGLAAFAGLRRRKKS